MNNSLSAPEVGGRKRVFFLNKTSDIFGSFTKKDLESYSNLIRRKVQERCATTQDLMQTIRRIKTGEAGYVTPNEFRFTLIKLGITLPQPVVNDLFNMFDSDRSGTMDFDEFAMWIMNSEFRPDSGGTVAKRNTVSPEDELRRKFTALVGECPALFTNLRSTYSFLELISEVNRLGIRSVDEKDVRSLFLLFDRSKTNSVNILRVKRWTETGKIDTSGSIKPREIPDLHAALIKVCGRTPDLLIKGFEYARGQNNVRFDEFRRSMLSCGLGQRKDDVENLFLALGGSKGTIDVEVMLAAVASLPNMSEPAHTGKHSEPVFSTSSRADRKIRQAIRKTYVQIRHALERLDTSHSGYVDADQLNEVIAKHCIALSHQDFRFVMKRVERDPNNPSRYNWQHFLQIYDPLTTPHELEGGSTRNPPRVQSFTALNPQIETKKIVQETSPMTGGSVAELNEVKKIWITVLRSCQRADPNRSGFINRTQFIGALQKTLHNSMSVDTMSKLADTYQRRDGLIDYKSCFRNTLSDLANTLPVYDDSSIFKPAEPTKAKKSGPVHPWDFDYVKQEIVHFDDPLVPHWQTATLKPRQRPSTTSAVELGALRLSPVKKTSSALSNDEADSFLNKYDPKVKSVCSKLVQAWKPIWKQLLVDMHDHSIKNHPGCITTDRMTEVLKNHGIRMTKYNYGVVFRYFRAIGLNDVFNYAEFVDVCNVCRNIDRFAATSV